MTTRVELPATLAGLQAALARGDFSVGEALAEQHRRCVENDRLWHACVAGTVRPPEVDVPTTTLLPLTGTALLHKDVFDRMEAEWYAWAATMLPENDHSFGEVFSAADLADHIGSG